MKPKVLLSARGQIDCVDAALSSIAGAQDIIARITSRRVVTKLILSHNELSDDGCIVLFTFLSSKLGKKYQINEINLNSNGIGDRGLEAIASYLSENVNLKELYLQNNKFAGSPQVLLSFTRALNRSKLRILSLTTNRFGDNLSQVFFPVLDCPTLGELHLSAIGATYHSVLSITDFLACPRCRLHTLKLNGNNFGYGGVRKIIRTLESDNFTILSLELHANNFAGPQDSDNTSGDDNDEVVGPDSWKDGEALLKRVLMRNLHLKREVEKEALGLLVCSRATLLRSGEGSRLAATNQPCSETCTCIPNTGRPIARHEPSVATHAFPFQLLPTELKLHILSLLAPTLSPMQRFTIFTHASSPATLPQLLPCLSSVSSESKVCIPDPTNSMMSAAGGIGHEDPELGAVTTPNPKPTIWPISNPAPKHSGCASGKCMGGTGSVLCHRMQERVRWLKAVKCTAYDPTFTLSTDT
ncbi:hypothetical protein AAF712_007525 [Marasmius tenuissimus]|uniref:RNI-like protein n=1 Tax=Marasmius tenuissimus TaxID=585030 RepID=A0ABR2ZWJ5_9AGAR